MTLFSKILLDIIPIAAYIYIAKWQAHRFDVEQKTIDHKKWTIAIAIGVTTFFALVMYEERSWSIVWLWFAAGFVHFPVHSTALNLFRRPSREWYYHNTVDPNGSEWDRWLGKYYVPVWFGCVVWWIGLQFLIF